MDETSVHVLHSVLLGFGTVAGGIIAYFLKGTMRRIEAIEAGKNHHETRIEVLEKAGLSSTVQDHETRLRAVEGGIAAINANIGVVVTEIKNIKDMVEKIARRKS